MYVFFGNICLDIHGVQHQDGGAGITGFNVVSDINVDLVDDAIYRSFDLSVL